MATTIAAPDAVQLHILEHLADQIPGRPAHPAATQGRREGIYDMLLVRKRPRCPVRTFSAALKKLVEDGLLESGWPFPKTGGFEVRSDAEQWHEPIRFVRRLTRGV